MGYVSRIVDVWEVQERDIGALEDVLMDILNARQEKNKR